MRPQVLTIAGSDSGGGAGIQADLKTFQELGVFGTSVLTAITAQNTLGVHGIEAISTEMIIQQIDAVADDFNITACKTGMLVDAERIEAVAKELERYHFEHVVVDPVMVAKGGASLLQVSAVEALRTKLLPQATIVTPNIPEAEVLAGMDIRTEADRMKAAQAIRALGVDTVIIKGGHADDVEAVDLIMSETEAFRVKAPRIQTKDTHGTGCTFSAALTAELAYGKTLRQAVVDAKQFIHQAITHELSIGQGHGPTNHWGHRLAKEEVITVDVMYETSAR
ncbi:MULTISPECIES: bifunctional hydroxymethylpyrimidine kinase/phosphomethylpyrimidine kinase [unclassified Exiguobacterium]|uniref:bifunctional hydroxymethylpyrimidine kinase/phosphomethylpyrimidine kinase n=1 Tax=unclassified Exiguobacterium TaxID=2644629 RepID=UPI001BE78F3D|nr:MULTISPECIES: bifunctional hydroxymethylpyrimidine kinase/phosphomethylpyrimidine kinase [unclassified Exiguobacterium]